MQLIKASKFSSLDLDLREKYRTVYNGLHIYFSLHKCKIAASMPNLRWWQAVFDSENEDERAKRNPVADCVF